jgi:hypothetical protein
MRQQRSADNLTGAPLKSLDLAKVRREERTEDWDTAFDATCSSQISPFCLFLLEPCPCLPSSFPFWFYTFSVAFVAVSFGSCAHCSSSSLVLVERRHAGTSTGRGNEKQCAALSHRLSRGFALFFSVFLCFFLLSLCLFFVFFF